MSDSCAAAMSFSYFFCALLTCVILMAPLYCRAAPSALPGYQRYAVEPALALRTPQAAFAFGEASVNPEDMDEAYIKVGQKKAMPKGIYHYSERVSGAEGGWALPGDGQWGKSDVTLSDTTSHMDGFSINPTVFSKPINVQLLTERRMERRILGDASPDNYAAALVRAQRVCRKSLSTACEAALRAYYQTKARQISYSYLPLHRQLVELGESARASLSGVDRRSMGVLIDLPGQKPLYMGAALDRGRNNDIRLKLNPV